MTNSAVEKPTPQNLRSRVLREFREEREAAERAKPAAKPARRRANEITSAIGLTPITGRSGPRIAY
ncbi:hypothetical protein [uncultured Paracoccus sp.]|uniref:hypothetical protein n=1 Tax=uncultured Paracoccus sp. TaxID=189685 RepID=UPI00263605AA|nr:hypothetical protein [uncultured Paracoccus sp.]